MKKILSVKLRQLRGEESQAAFAEKIGVKQVTYSTWERGSSARGARGAENTPGKLRARRARGQKSARGGPRAARAGAKTRPGSSARGAREKGPKLSKRLACACGCTRARGYLPFRRAFQAFKLIEM